MAVINIKIGMTLYCDDGKSTVKLQNVNGDNIEVLYNGKVYTRKLAIIGERLFTEKSVNKYTNSQRTSTNNLYKIFDKDGYDRQGFDMEGYDKKGYNRLGYDREGYNSAGYDKAGYNKEGYSKIGYNRDGYNRDGYNWYGYNKEGYNRSGFNKDGYDKEGYGKDGYNIDGYDRAGYNRAGYDKDGYSKAGYNTLGYDRYGYDIKGYDKYGYDRYGYDRAGYNKEGYDREGYNKNGYDIKGYDRTGFDKSDLNKDLKYRPGSILADRLTPNVTKLYHTDFGEGIFKKTEIVQRRVYLYVEFDSDVKILPYPDCFIRKLLSFEKNVNKSNYIKQPEPKDTEKSCWNCKYSEDGGCASWVLCDDYRPKYNISKEEIDSWPKDMGLRYYKR